MPGEVIIQAAIGVGNSPAQVLAFSLPNELMTK